MIVNKWNATLERLQELINPYAGLAPPVTASPRRQYKNDLETTQF
jgi:hypothetical protein